MAHSMTRLFMRPFMRRSLLLVLLPALLLSWLMLPLMASAHARLVKSTPAAGALLDAPPQLIQIEWSESVSLNFANIKIYDRERREQPIGALGQPASQDTVIKVSLPTPLPPGNTYTVVWKVVSAADGHVTAGSFAFRVRGSAGAGIGATNEETSPIAPDSSLVQDQGTLSGIKSL